jgi:photoactive yellow protein
VSSGTQPASGDDARLPQQREQGGPVAAADDRGSVESWRFDDPDLLGALESVPLPGIDALAFGLVVMDRDGIVLGYNQRESRLSGLPAAAVAGRNFFTDVGPCTNNYLVAQRYADSDELDEPLDYVFTFRMAPTPVRLRLLARKGSPRQYLAVQPR